MDNRAVRRRVRFGSFELDRHAGELWKSGSRLRVQERPLRVLEALLDRAGDVVTREELQRRLWSEGTFVDFENGLNSAINRLRASLGDSAKRPRFIETVGRRGYRFIAPVSAIDARIPAVPVHAAPASLERSGSAATRLAVLPFRQLKPDRDTEFLVFSLPDAIASSLSGLESIAVRSTLAASRFAGEVPDLAAIVAALDVTLVLGGTVLRAGDRVRVSTQLVEAPHGTLLWTATAETSVTDLFQVTDGLVARIVESLALPLTVRDERALKLDVPGSGRAYELYLRASGLGRSPDTWSEARSLYLESLQLDPNYAPAWARLGRVHRLIAKYAADDDPELTRLAEEAFRRALAVNPELSIAHHLYAQLEMETGRAVEAFGRLLDRARVRPADPQLFAGLVQACRYVGLLDLSRAAHARAKQIDPTVKTSVAYTAFAAGDYARAVIDARDNDDPLEGFALAAAGRTEDARRALQSTLRTHGNNKTWAAYLEMTMAFARGDRTGAMSLADACLSIPFRDPEGLFHLCLMFVWLKEPARAIHALRRTVDAGFCCLPALTCTPVLEVLLPTAEFEALRSEVERRHRRALAVLDSSAGHEWFGTPAAF